MNEPEDSDLLAAEYVLGTLDVADRVLAASRIETDPPFGRSVAEWQDRLAPLIETIEPVAPPDHLFDDLLVRLFGTPSAVIDELALARLKRRVRLWQGTTAGLSAIAAALLAWIALGDVTSQRPDRFTAVLQQNASAPAMVLDVDVKSRRLTVTSLATATPAGKSYELWIIDPAIGSPRSLGLIPARSATHELLTPYDPAVITKATYAVTVEPPGGSPTGQPSGTPILSGRLVSAPQ